mgnify:CR=1 FL=1
MAENQKPLSLDEVILLINKIDKWEEKIEFVGLAISREYKYFRGIIDGIAINVTRVPSFILSDTYFIELTTDKELEHSKKRVPLEFYREKGGKGMLASLYNSISLKVDQQEHQIYENIRKENTEKIRSLLHQL